jgi:hypothetical protein
MARRKVDDCVSALHYLLSDVSPNVCATLQRKYGTAHAALFEMAVKSTVLLLIYTPGADEATAVAGVIARTAPQAGLPDGLWRPVTEKIQAGSSSDDLMSVVFKMHDDVSHYLAR